MTNQIVPSPTAKTNPPTKSESTVDTPSKEELEAVRRFLATFEKAIKSYSLYPETHSISKNLLSGLENSLTIFFDILPDLKLEVEKDIFFNLKFEIGKYVKKNCQTIFQTAQQIF